MYILVKLNITTAKLDYCKCDSNEQYLKKKIKNCVSSCKIFYIFTQLSQKIFKSTFPTLK